MNFLGPGPVQETWFGAWPGSHGLMSPVALGLKASCGTVVLWLYHQDNVLIIFLCGIPHRKLPFWEPGPEGREAGERMGVLISAGSTSLGHNGDAGPSVILMCVKTYTSSSAPTSKV